MKALDALMSEGFAAWCKYMRGNAAQTVQETQERVMAWMGERSCGDAPSAMRVGAAAHWCDWGFPLIDIESQTYASAMAMTDPPAIHEAPWPVFVVRFPDALMRHNTILVVHAPDNGFAFSFHLASGHQRYDGVRVARVAIERLGSSVDEPVDYSAFGSVERLTDRGAREIQLGNRIAFNACASLLEQRENKRGDCQRTVARGIRSVPPKARRFVVGAPVSVDMRRAIKAYVEHGPRFLRKLHWLVRGHWRMQPCGVAGAHRRRQWIQPHWARRKGTEACSPVLLRAHVIRGGS